MENLNSRSVLSPNRGHKIVALEFCLISPLLLLLYLQNVLRGIGKAYVESLNSRSVLSPNRGHKIVALEFCLISPLLLLLYLQNVLRGIGKAYVESLNSRSVLPTPPPTPTPHPLMGQTVVINSCFGVFALYLSPLSLLLQLQNVLRGIGKAYGTALCILSFTA